jgi:hypothetical protein
MDRFNPGKVAVVEVFTEAGPSNGGSCIVTVYAQIHDY